MFTWLFWRDALERSLATAAQSALALLGADGFDLLEVDVADVFGVSLGGFVLAILKAVVASKLNDPNSASLIELDPPGRHSTEYNDHGDD
jgi:hypothetical protein